MKHALGFIPLETCNKGNNKYIYKIHDNDNQFERLYNYRITVLVWGEQLLGVSQVPSGRREVF